MRIGIMLRAIDEKGGIGVYTRYITRELLDLDRRNQYFLYYRNSANPGRFVRYQNVTERVLKSSHTAIWDQVSVPLACWKDKLDVLFHPKFTVPLLAPCKTVMVLHGAGWFIPEYQKFWKPADLRYIKIMMPLYCKKAAVILSVSQLTSDIFNQTFHLPPDKIKTVYFAPGKQFKQVEEEEVLQRVKEKYNLPDHFVFTLAKYGDGGRKNIRGILQAYQIHHGKTPHKLVIGGKDCQKLRFDYRLPEDGYGKDILFPGWMEQEDLPAVYSLADVYLYPSNMEAFPIPITEALACGTPIITSNLNGLKEIAGDAAFFVNADDPQNIADGLEKILSDPKLRQSLSEKSLEQSKRYSWGKCAEQTLEILESMEN
ncbi:MAG: glycosyltransferase family 4 protein [Calditrichaceae bacterium]|nr:glycosyltransferase family 4 protein [Calditrichia bacterium]NUQ40602.1 glycosyltransferase family 4 protein [Calditrichaceae bacterium]